MRRESAGSKHLLPDPRQTKEVTLQELLDRDSRQKPIRKPRENVVPDLKPEPKKEGNDKNLRINNLQREFEQLKNKIKHVENKNERILTKLKSYKDESREKSRSKTNQSISKADILPKLVTPAGSSQLPSLLTTIGQLVPNTMTFGNEHRAQPRDPYLIQYRRDNNSNSHYNILADENMSLQETNELLKMRIDKNERMMAEKNQIYEEKEAFYKDLLSNKEQQIERLKGSQGKADVRRLIDYINTTERMNAETRAVLERRVKELADRLNRVCKLVKLSERTIKQSKRRPDQKESVEFFNLKEKQLEMIIDQLQKDQKKLRLQNTQAVKQSQQARIKLEALRQSHEEELRELRNKYTTRMSAIQKKYTDEIKLNAEELVQLKHDRDDAIEQLTDEKLITAKIKKQLQQSEEKVKKTEIRYNPLIQDLKTEISSLRDGLSRSEQQKQSIQFELDKIKVGRTLKMETDIIAGNQAEKQQLSIEIKNLKTIIEKLQNQLNGLKRENWQLNLKLKKKEEFKIELEETYKQKLQQEARTTAMIREEKRKLELEVNQIRNHFASDSTIRQRSERQILQQIELICVLEADTECTLKSILETYRNQPLNLAVQALKALSDRKRLQAEDRERILKMIDPKKFQPIGTKRFEIQAIDYLSQTVATMGTELRLKQQAFQQMETRSKWEKELLEQEISKLKKSNEQLKRQKEKDDQEKKQRKSEAALVKESLEEEQKERYTEMRSLILKSETDKKQLEKRLKMLQFEMDEARDSYEELIRRKDRLEADKDRIISDFQKRLQDKDERIDRCQGQLREMKEDALKKKREYVAELRKLQYESSEKIAQLQHEIEEKQSQIALKDEQIVLLTNENNSLTSSFNAHKTKTSKQITETERVLRESLAKKDEQLKAKIAELTQTSALAQDFQRRHSQLQTQFKGKDASEQSLRVAIDKEKERVAALQKTRKEDKVQYEEKLRLKKENEDLLAKRLELKNAQSARYYQQIKDLKQRQEDAAEANKTVKSQVMTLKAECEKLHDKLVQKESSLATSEQRVRQIEDSRKAAEERAQELHQTHMARIKKLETSLRSAEQQVTAHQEQLDSVRTNLHQKEMQLAKLSRDTSGIRQQLIQKEAQIEQLKQLNEKAMGSNIGLKKEAEQYSGMLKAAELKQAQIDKLQKDLDRVIALKGQLEEKVRHLNQTLNKSQSKTTKTEETFQQTLQKEKENSELRIQNLKKEFEREKARIIEQLNHEKSMLMEDTTHVELKLKSQLTAVEDDLKIVKKDLQIAKGQLKSRTQQAELDYSNLKSQSQELKTQKQYADQTINKLITEIELLKKQLAQSQSKKKQQQTVQIEDEQMLLSPSRTPMSNPPASDSIKEVKELKQEPKAEASKSQSDNVHFFSIGEEQPSDKKHDGGMSDAQLKEFFSRIRIEIEKVLNQEEISVQIFQILPVELEGDFQELICEIRNRISEFNDRIQQQQLSFIYIDQNEQAYFGDSLLEEFPELAPVADAKQLVSLKEKISEQEKVIQNLTSEKEQHQNTINQMAQEKEQADEENEARFITQLSVMKKQLKEFKDRIDALDMLLAATKKTLFRVMEVLFSENTHMEQDLAESLNYYMSIVKLPEKEKQLLNTYFNKYTEKNKAKSKRSWFS